MARDLPIEVILHILELTTALLLDHERRDLNTTRSRALHAFLRTASLVHRSLRPTAQRLLLSHGLVTASTLSPFLRRVHALRLEDRIPRVRVGMDSPDGLWDMEISVPRSEGRDAAATARILEGVLTGMQEVEFFEVPFEGLDVAQLEPSKIQHVTLIKSFPSRDAAAPAHLTLVASVRIWHQSALAAWASTLQSCVSLTLSEFSYSHPATILHSVPAATTLASLRIDGGVERTTAYNLDWTRWPALQTLEIPIDVAWLPGSANGGFPAVLPSLKRLAWLDDGLAVPAVTRAKCEELHAALDCLPALEELVVPEWVVDGQNIRDECRRRGLTLVETPSR